MTGCHFVPSQIEDDIYGLMDDFILGSDLYDYSLCDAVENYFINCAHREYQLCCSPYMNDTRFGVCSVAWVEGAYPKMIVFDYCKEGIR